MTSFTKQCGVFVLVSLLYKIGRFHVAVCLFSKCDNKNTSYTLAWRLMCHFFVPTRPYFDVIYATRHQFKYGYLGSLNAIVRCKVTRRDFDTFSLLHNSTHKWKIKTCINIAVCTYVFEPNIISRLLFLKPSEFMYNVPIYINFIFLGISTSVSNSLLCQNKTITRCAWKPWAILCSSRWIMISA